MSPGPLLAHMPCAPDEAVHPEWGARDRSPPHVCVGKGAWGWVWPAAGTNWETAPRPPFCSLPGCLSQPLVVLCYRQGLEGHEAGLAEPPLPSRQAPCSWDPPSHPTAFLPLGPGNPRHSSSGCPVRPRLRCDQARSLVWRERGSSAAPLPVTARGGRSPWGSHKAPEVP